MNKFQVDNINDLELLYSVLRETYPKNEIDVVFNWNTKVYNVNVTDRVYKEDPEVPVDINIEVVYGDSVTGDTPVILRDPETNQIYIKTIDDITNEWQEYPEFKMFDQTIRLEKQYGLTNYEVWCDKGWNPIKKVIRHKTNKKIYRVLTHTGVVDVTEDHSLIRSNYEKVKPKDLKVGDDLLHSFPNEFNSNINIISNDRAYIYGFFYGDGDIETEEWKIINEYPDYSASTFGNIKNNKSNKILKVQNNGDYLVVSLKKDLNSYTKRVHRLIAQTFLNNPHNKDTVNHKNHNTKDDCLENLEWCTMTEQNIHKNTNMKNVHGKYVIQYDLNMNYINTFNSANEAMRITQIPASSIIYNCNGFNDNCHGFIWKYKNTIELKNEIWKDIEINNITFTVSNKGRVKSKKGIISYGSKENTGYYRVKSCTTNNGIQKSERISVHILVAKAFINNADLTKNIVNHIDGNKENNYVENLEWVTQKENMIHYQNNNKKTYQKINQDEYLNEKITLNNSDLNVLNYLKILLQKEYPNHKPIIYNTIESSGVYKLSINDQKEFIEEYRTKFYDSNKYKKIPVEILNSSLDVIQSFFNGYWAADGARKDKELIGCTRFDNKGKIGSAGLYYLMKRLGYKVSLNTRFDKPDILRLTVTKKEQRKICNKIKKIIECPDVTTEQFVYDLETEKGIFGAGVGKLQIANTDSCFLKFKYNRKDFEKNRKDTFKLASICGDNMTDKIFNRPPICLEFEKVFHPFILLTKKRYIANKYENPKDPFELKCVDAKGIALTRRDYCPMVKKCYKEIIDTIINDESINGKVCKEDRDCIGLSIDLYKKYLCDILEYKIDVNDLIVSAMLAASYKTRPVHVQLAEKLKLRKEEVQIGDRIPYIFIESSDPKSAKSELGEDPQYAIKNNLKYNRKCYIEQLAKPILGFYKIVLKDKEELLDDLIEYTNNCLVKCGGKKLKPSDFKIEE